MRKCLSRLLVGTHDPKLRLYERVASSQRMDIPGTEQLACRTFFPIWRLSVLLFGVDREEKELMAPGFGSR